MKEKTFTLTERELARLGAEATTKVYENLGNDDSKEFTFFVMLGLAFTSELRDLMFGNNESSENESEVA